MDLIKNTIFKIPIIGDLLAYIFDVQPIIGTIAVMVIAVFFINKIMISQLDVNLLKLIVGKFKNRKKSDKYDMERTKYHETISTKEYENWQNAILSKVYDDLPLVDLFGRKHMVVAQQSAKKMSYPFYKDMYDFGTLNSVDIPEYQPDKYQKYYYKVMSANIKKPDLVGFELDTYRLNSKDEITGYEANVCQYKHTVITSHILEYELYRLYKKNKSIVDAGREEILNALPNRKKIHTGQTNKEIVLKGKNRHSLLSVQMMIVCRDEKRGNYRVLIVQRSDEVALKPRYWHIIPAGGFEIFEKEEMRNKHIIEENFDAQLALFRELLEELYNGRDFQDNEAGHDGNNIIYQNPAIVKLEALIKEEKAYLDFIGSVTDLTTLRAELSFLLVVDDPQFLLTNFAFNFESAYFKTVRLDGLEKMFRPDSHELLYPSSAGLIELVKRSELAKEKNLFNNIELRESM